MCEHQFQKFQITCISVSFFTVSLWIFPVQDEIYLQIFQRNFLDISTLVLHNFRFLFETFRRHSWNVCKLIQNQFIVSVCLSICFNLNSAWLSLGMCEFLVFSGVNFETSGLVHLDVDLIIFFKLFEIMVLTLEVLVGAVRDAGAS